jgi:SAM-dependent MidA family methyltransferase
MGREPGRISFREFVEDALFHPAWGYYATGNVRFGLGGHYDTYPLALSPIFGRAVAAQARRTWRRLGAPDRFEICEIGAGNGQLALDVLVAVTTRSRRRTRGRWHRFHRALGYRIIERSPALIARQRATLGSLGSRVRWSRIDLARSAPPRRLPAPAGFVFGNEVLDCFAPHRVVPSRTGMPRVTHVVATLDGRTLGRGALARAMADDARRRRVRFREVLLPLDTAPGLAPFLRRHYPEFFVAGPRRPAYFACPQIGRFLRNVARLYDRAEAIFVDYGDTRAFHLRTREQRRLIAGTPRSGASVYRDPGRDDVTVMVDFSVVRAEAARAGWKTVEYGPQALLARGTGVRFDAAAVRTIAETRALGWLLSALGIDREDRWRRTALTWSARHATGGSLAMSARRDVDEFVGRRRTPFHLIRLRRPR